MGILLPAQLPPDSIGWPFTADGPAPDIDPLVPLVPLGHADASATDDDGDDDTEDEQLAANNERNLEEIRDIRRRWEDILPYYQEPVTSNIMRHPHHPNQFFDEKRKREEESLRQADALRKEAEELAEDGSDVGRIMEVPMDDYVYTWRHLDLKEKRVKEFGGTIPELKSEELKIPQAFSSRSVVSHPTKKFRRSVARNSVSGLGYLRSWNWVRADRVKAILSSRKRKIDNKVRTENPHKKARPKQGNRRYPKPDLDGKSDRNPFDHITRRPWEHNNLPPPGLLWTARAHQDESVKLDDTMQHNFVFEDGEEESIPSVLEKRPWDAKPGAYWKPIQVIDRRGPGLQLLVQPNWPGADTKLRQIVKLNNGTEDSYGTPHMPTADPSIVFKTENDILSRLESTGSTHFVQLWRPCAPGDKTRIVATDYMPEGTLAENMDSIQDLAGIWRLLQCLGRAMSILAYGSEDPTYEIKGWEPIIKFDWHMDDIFIDSHSGEDHTCGGESPSYKVGNLGYAAIIPSKSDTKKYGDFVSKGLERSDLKFLAKSHLPTKEQKHRSEAEIEGSQEIPYGSWTNTYLIGRMLKYHLVPRVTLPESEAELTPEEQNEFHADYRSAGKSVYDLYDYDGIRDLGNALKRSVPVNERLSRARLNRLLTWCTVDDEQARIGVAEFMIQCARGAAEAGDDTQAPMPKTWTTTGMDELQARYLDLVDEGKRPGVVVVGEVVRGPQGQSQKVSRVRYAAEVEEERKSRAAKRVKVGPAPGGRGRKGT